MKQTADLTKKTAMGMVGEETVAPPERILIADDDREMSRLIASTLRKAGYDVTVCATGINLLERLSSYLIGDPVQRFSLVVSDIRMPGVTGMEMLDGMRNVEGAPPVILITGFGDEETHRAAERLGAVTVLDKPFEMSTLLKLVRRTLSGRNAA